MRIIGNKKKTETESPIWSFEPGDLIVPHDGAKWAFYWRDGAKLDPKYKYHVATSAERYYFNSWMFNGYKLMGAMDAHEYPIKNFNTYVINYKDL